MYRGVLIEESLEDLRVLTLIRPLSTDVTMLVDPADGQPDRVFDYRQGDTTTLDAAKNHARGRGIPDAQVDWAVPQTL